MKIPMFLGESLGAPFPGSMEAKRDAIQNAVHSWIKDNYGKRTCGYVTATFADSVVVSVEGMMDPANDDSYKTKHIRFPYSLNGETVELGDPMEVKLATVIIAKKEEQRAALDAGNYDRLIETRIELLRLEKLKETPMAKMVDLTEFFSASDGRGPADGTGKGRKSRTSTGGTTHSGGISGATDGRSTSAFNKSSARKSRTATSGTTHGGSTGPDGRDPGMEKSSKRGAAGRGGSKVSGPKTGTTGDDAAHLGIGAPSIDNQATKGKGALETLAARVSAILMGQDPDEAVNEAMKAGEFSYSEIAAMVEGNPEIKQRLASLSPEYANAKQRSIVKALEAVGARFYEDEAVRDAILHGKFDPDWVKDDEED